MEGDGPSAGKTKNLNLISASCDTAILDAFLLNALGYDIKRSQISKNLKTTKDCINKVEVLGAKITDFDLQNFCFPSLRKLDLIPNFIVRILGRFLRVTASVNKKVCAACMLCQKACPVKAIEKEGSFPKFDSKKCISCFCCHEMCPYKAVKFKKTLLAKFFIREN
jgi:Fe-S-cluster-containing hydrogenase component 2